MFDFSKKAIKYIHGFDPLLFFLCFFASVYGLVLIYSATFSYNQISYVKVQALAVCLGSILYIFAALFNTDCIEKLWPFILCLNLLFLITLRFWGIGDTNRSWLRFGSIGIQPAEVGKVLFILTFAEHLSKAKSSGMRAFDIFSLILHAGIVMCFVFFFSRDDGMTLAYAAIALSMSFFAGVPVILYIAAAAVVCAVMPYAWSNILDNYQRSRILAVLDPEMYPDEAYQALHSRMAIRSGGIFGEGYLSGVQTQRGLIPTKHTDSIFPVAGEEFGLIGSIILIALLLAIIFRIISTAHISKHDTDKFICTGIASMIAFQTVLNLGMNLGIFPIVGLTLPFFSYGGSSIITMFAAAGLAAGIRRRDRMYFSEPYIYIRRYK